MKSAPVIQISNLSVQRGDAMVLRDVNFVLRARECVALLGPNGSGKSTFVKTLSRELYPARGTIKMFGRETWDVFELRHLLGLVSNDLLTWFQTDMRVEEAVLSGFFSSVGLWKNNVVTAPMKSKAAQALKKMNLFHLKDKLMDHLSSGEARRVLIARALVNNPRLLILDEPMNSLDFVAQHNFRLTLSRLARAGRGLLLVTHQISDIIPEIKRIVLMKDGRFVATGHRNEMLAPKMLKRVYGVTLL